VALTLVDESNTVADNAIAIVQGDLDGINGPDLITIHEEDGNPLDGGDESNGGNGGDGEPRQPLQLLFNESKPRPTTCVGDIDLSGAVNVVDLLSVISSWGVCPAPPPPCPAYIAPPGPPVGDGTVNVLDLLTIINHWGVCP